MLLAEGWTVLVYDRLDPGRRDFLPAGTDLVVGDICDGETLRRAVANFQPDVVFHAAALHYIPDCDARPQETLRTNVEGVEVVVRAAKDFAVGRLVFCSTAAVYAPFDGCSHEADTPIRPIDIYGHSKYFGEHLIDWAAARSETSFVIARLFNVYGPRETNPHLIPTILSQVLSGQCELSLGNLESRRDYVFVEDVARALALLGRPAPEPSEGRPIRVNISTGRSYSALDVITVLQTVSGRSLSWTQDPARLRASDRPVLMGDPSALVEAIGWAPTTDLETGLARLWAWAQAHPELMVG